MLSTNVLKRLADIGGSGLHQGMPAEAGAIFAAILPFCPRDSTGPLIGLAMAKYGQGEAEEAIEILRDRALEIDPGCADSLSHLAMVLRAEGRADESQAYLQRASSQSVDEVSREFIEKVERGRFDA